MSEPIEQPADGSKLHQGAANQRMSRAEIGKALALWRDHQVRQPTESGRASSAVDALRRGARASHASRWSTVAHLELQSVTPIYGGGARAGEPDLLVPFRPRAIRNCIRHWWWLLNRHDRKYLAQGGSIKLYEDTVALWGADSVADEDRASRVRVSVNWSTDKGPNDGRDGIEGFRFTYLPYKSKRDGGIGIDFADPLHYALFGAKGKPLPAATWVGLLALLNDDQDGALIGGGREKRGRIQFDAKWNTVFAQRPSDLLAPGLTLSLRVEADKSCDHESLRRAIHAWILYGGVGARTSRGMGHLRLIRRSNSISGWNKEDCNSRREQIERVLGFDRNSWIWSGPRGGGAFTAATAHHHALNCYREFRQLRVPSALKARYGGIEGRPGRSFFSKADVVRRLTGRDLKGKHPVRHGSVPDPVTDPLAYTSSVWPLPELYFGAPIVLKFLNDDDGEPWVTDLLLHREHTVYERFPSPVLTIPWWDGASWQARILALPYENDLAGVGATIRNQPNSRNNNNFTWNGATSAGPVRLDPGRWWPTSNFVLSKAIWRNTPFSGPPGPVIPGAERLSDAGDVDPIRTLFNYLHGRVIP